MLSAAGDSAIYLKWCITAPRLETSTAIHTLFCWKDNGCGQGSLTELWAKKENSLWDYEHCPPLC